MSELGNNRWTGRSGMDYEYWVCPLDASFADIPGNFIYAAKDESGDWRPLYIAAADSLRKEIREHPGVALAIDSGATHLHVHLHEDSGSARENEKADLIARWRPPCNPESQPRDPSAEQAAGMPRTRAAEPELSRSERSPASSQALSVGRQEDAAEPILMGVDTVLTVTPGKQTQTDAVPPRPGDAQRLGGSDRTGLRSGAPVGTGAAPTGQDGAGGPGREASNAAADPILRGVDTVLTVTPGKQTQTGAAVPKPGATQRLGGSGRTEPKPGATQRVGGSGRTDLRLGAPVGAEAAPASRDGAGGPGQKASSAAAGPAPQSCKWGGASGRDYQYWVFSLDAPFAAEAGNYIYALADTREDIWRALYVGQTGDLQAGVRDHPGAVLARSRGATHLHVHKSVDFETARELEQQDLIAAHNPPCQS